MDPSYLIYKKHQIGAFVTIHMDVSQNWEPPEIVGYYLKCLISDDLGVPPF